MCDTDNSVSARQEDAPSPTSELGSKIWLTGPICSPYRLCLASLLSGMCFQVRLCRHIIISISVRSYMQTMSGQVMRSNDWKILAIIFGGSFLIYGLNCLAQTYFAPLPGEDQYWMMSLVLNLIGYSTVLLPGYYVIQYVRKSNYLDLGQPSFLQPLVRLCVKGTEADNIESEVETAKETENNESNK